uniref:Gamma-secretase subunit PEN-2 n=1 Tax=Heligmosomoides polygyrus TaxID=6339 RepID=A0A183GWU0_HELPZ
MDLRNMNDAAKVDLCRKYFIVGLFGLPFLWLRNTIWFFGFLRPRSSATNTNRKYVTLSAIGAIFWLIVICVWETIFQSYRKVSHGRTI